jgi:hypothetical protein
MFSAGHHSAERLNAAVGRRAILFVTRHIASSYQMAQRLQLGDVSYEGMPTIQQASRYAGAHDSVGVCN